MGTRAFLVAFLGALSLPAAAAGQAPNPWLEKRVLTIAHQGGEDENPSNTLYGFRRAVRDGADMLELDVGVTRDGKVVVTHDTSVDRTTDGAGLVVTKSLRALRRLDAAHWFAGGANAYARGRPRAAYRFRGIATGERGRRAASGAPTSASRPSRRSCARSPTPRSTSRSRRARRPRTRPSTSPTRARWRPCCVAPGAAT